MKLFRLKLFLLALSCLFAVSCANKTLIRDSEYNPVYQALGQKNANEALLTFPDKEENVFICGMTICLNRKNASKVPAIPALKKDKIYIS